ncbi:hypothetical protein CEXT_654021 [Caerostris extrusa]|uniref:Ycf15 n=1 Tax=Caerostris extrusa TaxID=172846 RepID=A0AAV4SQ42_CAEEX|nr:hypothetical protein CEXT_654021 [Caerostris extrusa]
MEKIIPNPYNYFSKAQIHSSLRENRLQRNRTFLLDGMATRSGTSSFSQREIPGGASIFLVRMGRGGVPSTNGEPPPRLEYFYQTIFSDN